MTRDDKGRIQRSEAARHAFARQTGYPNGRHDKGRVENYFRPAGSRHWKGWRVIMRNISVDLSAEGEPAPMT